MYKFKMKLLYNEEERFCSKTDLLNFKITLPLATLNMVSSNLVSNDLTFSDNIWVAIPLVTCLLLFSIWEPSFGTKTKQF